jgi:hypothetical protein
MFNEIWWLAVSDVVFNPRLHSKLTNEFSLAAALAIECGSWFSCAADSERLDSI